MALFIITICVSSSVCGAYSQVVGQTKVNGDNIIVRYVSSDASGAKRALEKNGFFEPRYPF